MAYRKIHDDFWTDPDIEDLTPEQKFFYLYLITNPAVNQIGLYEFSIKRAVFETGYNRDTIEKLLDYFESIGKIKRSQISKEILICKFYHHNRSNSPKVVKHCESLLSEVKDTVLIQYIYSMDTLSQKEEEKEEEKEETQEEEKGGIPSKSDVENYFEERGEMITSDIPGEAENFMNHYEERKWKNTQGKKITEWKRQASTWINNYKKFNESRLAKQNLTGDIF